MIRALSKGLEPYAQVFFAKGLLPGALLLLATWVVPAQGLAGLLGGLFAILWALLFQPAGAPRLDTFVGLNGLLTGLALGMHFRLTAAFLLLLCLGALWVLLLAQALRALSARTLALPVLSLPFVIATWTLLLAAHRFSFLEVTVEPVWASAIGAGFLPEPVELYLRSLGAAFFQLSVLSGLLVFLGLLVWSRWAVLLSIIGYGAGLLTYRALGGEPSDITHEFLGFNFILAGLAVGGIFVVLRPGSLLLAALSGAVAAVLCSTLHAGLLPWGLPPLALPFVAVVQLTVLLIGTSRRQAVLELVPGEPASPEQNAREALFRRGRYPDPSLPVFALPVLGEWVVSQGPDGAQTHQGPWRYAWDFVVRDGDREHSGEGRALADYFAFHAPAVAPGDGRVVATVNHVEDNPIGEVNTRHNWGNVVVLAHAGGVYSVLAHLEKGSVAVREGEAVVTGQVLARVGNSGRSPTPHLHFQVQASPLLGAPTLPARFVHFQQQVSAERRYVTHGAPGLGDRVAALSPIEGLRACLTLAPGRTYRWKIRQAASETREGWESRIDPLGGRRLVASGDRGELGFFSDRAYLTSLWFRGNPRSLLSWFYLGLPRVPFCDDERLRWSDRPDVWGRLSFLAARLYELALPFIREGWLRTTSRLVVLPAGARVITELAWPGWMRSGRRREDRIEVVFGNGVGPVELKVFCGTEERLSATLEPEGLEGRKAAEAAP